MGTFVFRGKKEQVVRERLRRVQRSSAVIASRLTGNRLWYLARADRGDGSTITWIGLTLVESRRGEVFVKSMDESSGPFFYDCPLSFLEQADAPVGPYATAWREQVRAFHAARAVRTVAIRLGARVRLGTQVFELVRSLGRRGWQVSRESDGVMFRMTRRQLSVAEVVRSDVLGEDSLLVGRQAQPGMHPVSKECLQ